MPPMRSTNERGLGWEHQQERRRQLATAEGQICWRCGEPMFPSLGQAIDLDHVVSRALGGVNGPRRLAHRRCNRRAGAILGNRLRRGQPRPRRAKTVVPPLIVPTGEPRLTGRW